MTRKRAAQTQDTPGAARTETETEDRTWRGLRPAGKTKPGTGQNPGLECGPECGPVMATPGAAGPLPPPHPALVELVRLLARVSARQARTEQQETQQ